MPYVVNPPVSVSNEFFIVGPENNVLKLYTAAVRNVSASWRSDLNPRVASDAPAE